MSNVRAHRTAPEMRHHRQLGTRQAGTSGQVNHASGLHRPRFVQGVPSVFTNGETHGHKSTTQWQEVARPSRQRPPRKARRKARPSRCIRALEGSFSSALGVCRNGQVVSRETRPPRAQVARACGRPKHGTRTTKRLAEQRAEGSRRFVAEAKFAHPPSGPKVRPNPSLERTSTGLALGPRTGQCHLPLRGPSANPAASAQLKR
jgi:hypothetical protein